ncbi:chromate efflux transporter [Pseudoroseomonas wenyumeiae]|uniref:Chromate efflux transporter n=1 Tax=Teichococcus wenyumeiae TaxID=2478470 RepID=A0A3A9JHA8_9PROT|nr:chromate efflux transporter [Pseudoroseomonas wenyumeiae]RKK05952.1 chromate efflux transporter [Pseudoroseomonas wenyumeiae]RMI19910.1 chromate efflux transporter [Pseudoroseomonas wenyumeiae]
MDTSAPSTAAPNREGEAPARNSFFEILLVFLRLGLTSFGGPIAHIGYFREEFVTRQRWLDEKGYADLVALGQFLPGPASSQVGFALGLLRGGLPGGAAAWLGFTMPSALVMLLTAYGVDALAGETGAGVVHGLKLVAVAVVAQAVWGMANGLCPDRPRATLAILTAVALLLLPSALTQVGVLLAGAAAGLSLYRSTTAAASDDALPFRVPRAAAVLALALFPVLLIGLPLLATATGSHAVETIDAFYRAGSLVFGGGHVVLPLLERAMVPTGWISADAFLAGYGVTQAVPGPLFTFAAFLGAAQSPWPNGVLGGAIALLAVFLPGILLMYGMLPFWDALRQRPAARAALMGVNAAVVGILAAALFDPIWTSTVRTPADFAIALLAFAALVLWRVPAWLVVVLTSAAGLAAAALPGAG